MTAAICDIIAFELFFYGDATGLTQEPRNTARRLPYHDLAKEAQSTALQQKAGHSRLFHSPDNSSFTGAAFIDAWRLAYVLFAYPLQTSEGGIEERAG